jgi:Cu+-exporting ATPase
MKGPREEPTYKDPVCGMAVSLKTAAATAEYKGKTYYFCAPSCRDKFVADPESYLHGRRHA